MTNILAIDTSTEACSAALLYQGKTHHNFMISERDHTKLILPMIDDLLTQANCDLSKIDAIAFTTGPGSFTGVRIGIGIAQGLALGIDKPMIGISTLNLLAQGAYSKKAAKQVVAAIDARMGEVYLGVYQWIEEGVWQLMIDECVIKPDQVNAYLSSLACLKQDTYYAGTGWQTYGEMVNYLHEGESVLPIAKDMLPIAQAHFSKGLVTSVDKVEATYLRNEVTWKKLPNR